MNSAVAVTGTEPAEPELTVTAKDRSAVERSPKHLLEKGPLGRPRQGQERVSDLAARHDESAGDPPPEELSDNVEDEENVT